MFKEKYTLELYTPHGDYAGLLDVYNLNVNLSIEERSTISFNIAAYIDAEENMRLFDVLDLYEVVLTIYDKPYRFVLQSTPASFDSSGPRYLYEGLSIESDLDRKNIASWIGAERNIEFYKMTLKKKEENEWAESHFDADLSFSFDTKNTVLEELYPEDIADYIEVFEIRENTKEEGLEKIFKKTPLVWHDESGIGLNRGMYELEKEGSNVKLTIAPFKENDIFTELDEDADGHQSTQRIPLMDDDLGIYYLIFLNPPLESKENREANALLISDAAEKINFEGMENYKDADEQEEPNIETYYTTEGIFLDEVLEDILPKPWKIEFPEITYENDGETIKEKPEFLTKQRSGFEFNNISVLSILDNLADSYDAVWVSEWKKPDELNGKGEFIIKFYSNYETIPESTTNLITLEEGAYLKAIEKSLDMGEIATNIYGIGEDYISTDLFSPTKGGWIDFSYYVDEYWHEDHEGEDKTELALTAFLKEEELTFKDGLKSRWMDKDVAAKIATWQRVRDAIVEIYMSEDSVTIPNVGATKTRSLLENAIGIIQKREDLIKELTRLETKFLSFNSKAEQYERLVKVAKAKMKASNKDGKAPDSFKEEEDIRTYSQKVAEENYDRYNPIAMSSREKSAHYLDKVKDKTEELKVLDETFLEIRELLESYFNNSLKLKEEQINKFKFDYVLQDTTVSSSKDLLEKVKEYAAENSKPKVTLNVDIIDILAAHDVPKKDKRNLFVGNYLYVNFPMFNVDEKVQIKSMSIDFDSNSIGLEISNVERYAKGLIHKMVKNIRKLGEDYLNQTKYNKDNLSMVSTVSHATNERINTGQLVVGGGDSPNIISSGGFSQEEGETDHNLDEIVVLTKKIIDRVDIGDGRVFLERESRGEDRETGDPYVMGSQVLMSLEEGFSINQIAWYKAGGFGADESPANFDKKFLRNVFNVSPEGNIEMEGHIDALSGSIGGWSIEKDSLSSTGVELKSGDLSGLLINRSSSYEDKIVGGSLEPDNKKGLFIGIGKVGDNVNENGVPTAGYNIYKRPVIAAKNNKDFFLWNGRNLQLSGNIKANRGKIAGWNITGDRLYKSHGGDYVGLHTPNYDKTYFGTPEAEKGEEDYITAFTAGGERWKDASFAVTYDGKMKANQGFIGGWEIIEDSIQKGFLEIKRIGSLSGVEFKIEKSKFNQLDLSFDGGFLIEGTSGFYEIRKNGQMQGDWSFEEDFIKKGSDAIFQVFFEKGLIKILPVVHLVEGPLGQVSDFFRGDFIVGSDDILILESSGQILAGGDSYEGASFAVNSSGTMKAESGKIGGWEITPDSLMFIDVEENKYMSLSSNGEIYSGADSYEKASFAVDASGKIKAKSGKIGEWILSDQGSLYRETRVFAPVGWSKNEYEGSVSLDSVLSFDVHAGEEAYSTELSFEGLSVGNNQLFVGLGRYYGTSLELGSQPDPRPKWEPFITSGEERLNIYSEDLVIDGRELELRGLNVGMNVGDLSIKAVDGGYFSGDGSISIEVAGEKNLRASKDGNEWRSISTTSGSDVSSEVVKDNITDFKEDKIEDFLEKLEIKKYTNNYNKKEEVFFIIENEIKNKNPYSDMLFRRELRSSFKELPEYLQGKILEEDLSKPERGDLLDFTPLVYDQKTLTGIIMASLKYLNKKRKSLEERVEELESQLKN